MNRLLLLCGAVAVLATIATMAAILPDLDPEAGRLHQEAFVFDAHLHVINRQFYQGGDFGRRMADGQVDLPRIREGGVDAFFGSLYIAEEYYPGRFETKHALRLIDAARKQIAANRESVALARDASEIEQINRQGKIALVLDLEGGFDLDGDLGVLRSLYRLGLRVAQLPAHNWTNHFADSCCAAARWGGINEQGRAVIREMNRLGMVINVSHASDQALAQAVEASSDPVVATHHGLRSFNDIPRTMPDDLLRKLADKGGVIGFHIGNSFHNQKFFEWKTRRTGRTFWDTSGIGARESALTIEAIDRLMALGYPYVGPEAPEEILLTVDQWVDVVDRAITLVGEDHVALGSDFDGGPTPPRGMKDVSDLAMVTEAMLRRGYSEERIRKFLGGNLLRVFRQITG